MRRYRELGVPIRVGSQFAALRTRLAALPVFDLARTRHIDFNSVAQHYFILDRELCLYEIRKWIEDIETKTIWEDQTRVAHIQELYRLAAALTAGVLGFRKAGGSAEYSLDAWTALHHQTIRRYQNTLESMSLGNTSGLPAIAVVFDKLRSLERETSAGPG